MKTYDLNQAATLLHMSPEGLRRLAKAGKVPGKKAGKRWVFVEDHLAEWLKGNYANVNQAEPKPQEKLPHTQPNYKAKEECRKLLGLSKE